MHQTKKVFVGDVMIGGGAPISIQTMTTVKTTDVDECVNQIEELSTAGADILRLAIPDMESAESFGKIKKRVKTPLVADIHFDWRLALTCIKNGADKIRINPGNIGDKERVAAVARAARDAGIPIRIGVNSGSIKPEFLEKYESLPRAMVESAKEQAAQLEAAGLFDIVISLKASNVQSTVEACRLMAAEYSYPLHLGVTEAGTPYAGIIKSAAGIGCLLLDGIGDTIRVSLTAPPKEEVRAARTLLSAIGLKKSPELISCPTCGRCKIDLLPIARAVEKHLDTVKAPVRAAVMGCEVNGPGEASEADVGIAGGDGCAVLFKKGKIIKKVPEDRILEVIISEIDKIAKTKE